MRGESEPHEEPEAGGGARPEKTGDQPGHHPEQDRGAQAVGRAVVVAVGLAGQDPGHEVEVGRVGGEDEAARTNAARRRRGARARGWPAANGGRALPAQEGAGGPRKARPAGCVQPVGIDLLSQIQDAGGEGAPGRCLFHRHPGERCRA
jgi:hypothetical protein